MILDKMNHVCENCLIYGWIKFSDQSVSDLISRLQTPGRSRIFLRFGSLI